MNVTVLKHLWRSAEVRNALKKELWRLALFITLCIGVVAVNRYFSGRPITEGILSAAMGAFGITLMWLVAAVRTVRKELREQDLLDR